MNTRRAFRDLVVITVVTIIGFSIAYFYLYGRGRMTHNYDTVVDPLGPQLLVIQQVNSIPDFLSTAFVAEPTPSNIELGYFIQLPDQGWEEPLDKILAHLKSLKVAPATFISITAYAKGMENKIISQLKDAKSLTRVFFHSPHENVAREIHRELPDVPMVISRAEASRLFLMSTLKLEALPRLEGQIFWADFIKDDNKLSPDLVAELKKRHVPLLFGPANDESQWQRLVGLKCSGIITDNAPKLISWLKTQPHQ